MENEVIEKQTNETDQFEEVSMYQEVEAIKEEVRTDSYFDGSLLELIAWKILAAMITIVTFGIAGPWADCVLYSYKINHTVYNGKRLKFEGKGGDLYVNNFKWTLLSIITFGIYAFWIPVKKAKWVISNIHFEDEPFNKNENFFDGKTIQFIGVNLLCVTLNLLSLGFLYPFTVCYKLRWINKHTVINRKKIVFDGKAIQLFGKYLLWYFLTLITLGIYGWWLPIKMLKWQTKHTHIKRVGEIEEKQSMSIISVLIIIICILLGVLVFRFVGSTMHKNAFEGEYEDNLRSSSFRTEAAVVRMH